MDRSANELRLPFPERRVVVLDTETTGLSAAARIVEIAAVEADPRSGRLGPRLHSLVDPRMPIPPVVTRIHGIGQREVAGQPPFDAIADVLCAFLRNATVVAQNAPFDRRVLDAELTRSGRPALRELGTRVVDTVTISRALFPLETSHSLDSICDRTGVDRTLRTRHGALLDAELLAGALPHLAAAYDVWRASADAPSSEHLEPFASALDRLCAALEATGATHHAERADEAFLRVAEAASALRRRERELLARVEAGMYAAGWTAKYFALRWSTTHSASWRDAAAAFLAGADLAPYQSTSEIQMLTTTLDRDGAATPALPQAVEAHGAALLDGPWTAVAHAAFALARASERIARVRDGLRQTLLRCAADGYALRNATLHEGTSTHTNYRAAVEELAPETDVTAFTHEHRTLKLRTRDLSACAELFGDAGAPTLFDTIARVA